MGVAAQPVHCADAARGHLLDELVAVPQEVPKGLLYVEKALPQRGGLACEAHN